MSVSQRIAQEDAILREIRLSLNALGTLQSSAAERRGTVYASAPITSGLRLYQVAKRDGFASVEEFRRTLPDEFQRRVFKPNLKLGCAFGELLEKTFPKVIVPGRFFAQGWTQEHYMSLWRQVIVRHARRVAFASEWCYSLGCGEEFVIAMQHGKTVLDCTGMPISYKVLTEILRHATDAVDEMGFDPKPHYELWRLATLTLESRQPVAKTA